MAAETDAVETGVGSLDGAISHCGKPMRKRSERTSWTGKPGAGAEHTTIELTCRECTATATLNLTEEC